MRIPGVEGFTIKTAGGPPPVNGESIANTGGKGVYEEVIIMRGKKAGRKQVYRSS
jgi:hypothetical protein